MGADPGTDGPAGLAAGSPPARARPLPAAPPQRGLVSTATCREAGAPLTVRLETVAGGRPSRAEATSACNASARQPAGTRRNEGRRMTRGWRRPCWRRGSRGAQAAGGEEAAPATRGAPVGAEATVGGRRLRLQARPGAGAGGVSCDGRGLHPPAGAAERREAPAAGGAWRRWSCVGEGRARSWARGTLVRPLDGEAYKDGTLRQSVRLGTLAEESFDTVSHGTRLCRGRRALHGRDHVTCPAVHKVARSSADLSSIPSPQPAREATGGGV